jgi:excisionase family DNA binding protein
VRDVTKLPDNIQPRGLTIDQAAEYWGISTRTLRRYIEDGIAPPPMARGSKNGKLIFDRLALDAAMDALSERVA